jgi:hypothetical protein
MELLACLSVIVAGAISTAGQVQPHISLPSLDEIVAKYEKAVGGKAALEKLTSRVSKWSFFWERRATPAPQKSIRRRPTKW